jgi:hypothetical protein
MPSKKHLDARRQRNAKFWKQRAGKDQARRSPKIMAVCPGTTVFVETSAWEPALADAFREHKCRRVDDRVLADIWFSRDPAKPSGKTHLCASMKGGLVVSLAWWLTPPGMAIAYERALR